LTWEAQLSVSLEPQKRYWDEIAELDPLWAILSDASRQHGGWDVGEFFETGEREISDLMDQMGRRHFSITCGSVLDFGCGVGRLTRAFSSRFQVCYGLDISERMIENARRLNAGYVNCHFVVNTSDNLHIFPDGHFDLVYTNLVLQHISRREIITSYIREFMRTLRPGGLLIFQLPSHIPLPRRVQWRRRAYSALRALGVSHTLLYNQFHLNPMKMSFIPASAVAAIVRSAGGQTVFIETKQTPEYLSSTYYVTILPTKTANIQNSHPSA
jgi:ubiquinone/menaquinone biosynthesis C-methylase UbiE